MVLIPRSPVLTPPRLLAPRLFAPGKRDDYLWRIRSVRPGNLIGLWALDELNGGIAHDLSGRGHNGTVIGADPAKQGIGDGRTCMWFDGSTDYVNIYSAALAATFNGAQGSLGTWGKTSPGVWTDGAAHGLARLAADASANTLQISKEITNNIIRVAYVAGNVSMTWTSLLATSGFFNIFLTWDAVANKACAYLNGVQLGATKTGLGTWAGALSNIRCTLGATSTVPTGVFAGWLGPTALWTCALSHEEIEYLGPRALGLAA